MGRRTVDTIGVTALLAIVVLLLAGAPDAVQDAVARTPWGEPDLQGIWTNNYETPLQRPSQFADKEFFTDEERAELQVGYRVVRRGPRRGGERSVPLSLSLGLCFKES